MRLIIADAIAARDAVYTRVHGYHTGSRHVIDPPLPAAGSEIDGATCKKHRV